MDVETSKNISHFYRVKLQLDQQGDCAEPRAKFGVN